MDNRQHLTWDNPKQSVIEAVMNEGIEEQERKREGGKGKGNKWEKAKLIIIPVSFSKEVILIV